MTATAQWRILLALTALTIGRAMTLPFIPRAGGQDAGDPPDAWLMPLLGDAAVGLTAIVVLVALWRRRSPGTWAAAMAWSTVGAFDALAAYVVQQRTPWPDFFMIRTFGSSMFFAGAAVHCLIIALLAGPSVRQRFGVEATAGAHSRTSGPKTA